MSKSLRCLVFAALVVTGTTFADDLYVRAGASGKGSLEAPFGELWKAVERAQRGDVIHVAAGTYNGKGGAGHFKISVPNLTLAGGYSADFSTRDPFRNLTILERSKDFRGDWTGLPEGIIAGDDSADHGGLTVDGFVLDCTSRNVYDASARKVMLKAPSYPGKAVQGSGKDFKLRNCVILSPVGEGIYWTWQGQDNEVSNNFILNTFYAAIDARSAQPGSVIAIRNNTIAFVWFYPSKGGGIGIFVGRLGQAVIENNVLAFLQTEGGEAGYAVSNTFGNEDTIMRGNVFFSTPGGFYKYMDRKKANLIVWKADELDDLNDEEYREGYMLSESGENKEVDPGLVPDKDYALLFADYVGSEPGKLNMDAMNKWRQALGFPLQAQAGTPRPILAPPYPRGKVVPGLVSTIPGAGVQVAGPFPTYASAPAAATLNYAKAVFDSFKKSASKYEDGAAVEFSAGMGDIKTTYEIDAVAPRADYLCVQLLIPGSTGPSSTRDVIYGYLLKGSDAHKDWEKLLPKRDKYYAAGIVIRGQAYNFKNQSYPYPYGIVITEVNPK